MNLFRKVQEILPLSAASLALLQSTFPSRADLSDPATTKDVGSELNGQFTIKTDHLLLAPPHHEELLKMYAGHSSHASHTSHASHYSSAGGYSAPAAPPARTPNNPAYPTYPTYPNSVQPNPPSKPVAPSYTYPVTSATTNSVKPTNTTTKPIPTRDADVDFLMKRAAEGQSNAQFSLAIYYLYGTHGLPKSAENAKLLLKMSALQGNTIAQARLDELNNSEPSSTGNTNSPSIKSEAD